MHAGQQRTQYARRRWARLDLPNAVSDSALQSTKVQLYAPYIHLHASEGRTLQLHIGFILIDSCYRPEKDIESSREISILTSTLEMEHVLFAGDGLVM